VMAEVLVGDEAQSGREKLGLREGLDVGKVQVTSWVPESPGGPVICTWLTPACCTCREGAVSRRRKSPRSMCRWGARVLRRTPTTPGGEAASWRRALTARAGRGESKKNKRGIVCVCVCVWRVARGKRRRLYVAILRNLHL
jgi:hypothetical protein